MRAAAGSHPATLTAEQIVDLSQFLRERVEAVARNRTPTAPIDVLTGDPEAGRTYFFGAGRCSTCHSPTGDFAGLRSRTPDALTLQQRFVFPTLTLSEKRVEVTVTPLSGAPVSGTLVRVDKFRVSLRDASGDYRAFSATCTHLQCVVEFRKAERDIFCNCHNGQYDLNGRNIAGPPPRPLTLFAVHRVERKGQAATLVVERA